MRVSHFKNWIWVTKGTKESGKLKVEGSKELNAEGSKLKGESLDELKVEGSRLKADQKA